jgi:hypothetical protein
MWYIHNESKKQYYVVSYYLINVSDNNKQMVYLIDRECGHYVITLKDFENNFTFKEKLQQ